MQEREGSTAAATAIVFMHHVFRSWFLRRMQEREGPTAEATATVFKHHIFPRWFLRKMQEREGPTAAATAILFKHHVFPRWFLRRMQEREGPTAAATAIPSFFSTLPHSILKTSGYWKYLLVKSLWVRYRYRYLHSGRTCISILYPTIHQLSVNKLDDILLVTPPPPPHPKKGTVWYGDFFFKPWRIFLVLLDIRWKLEHRVK